MKIVIIGDSIALSLFQNAATLILVPGGHTVTNISTAGHTAGQQLAAWQASAERGDQTISCAAVCSLGINDVRTAVPVATALNNVNLLRDDMRANNPSMRIVFSLMLPARLHQDVVGRYFSHWIPLNAQFMAMTGWDCITPFASMAANDGTGALASGVPWGGEVDKLHPSVAGNREHAKYIRRAIDDAMARLTCSDLDHPTRSGTGGWRDTLGTSTSNGLTIVSGHKCPVCP